MLVRLSADGPDGRQTAADDRPDDGAGNDAHRAGQASDLRAGPAAEDDADSPANEGGFSGFVHGMFILLIQDPGF